MSRITLQMKGFLSLACSAAAAIGFSFATNRWDQPNGKWIFPAVIGIIGFLMQSLLIFVESGEEQELARYRRPLSAKLEGDARKIESENEIAEAIAEQVLSAIKSGNVDGVEKWSDLRRRHYGQ